MVLVILFASPKISLLENSIIFIFTFMIDDGYDIIIDENILSTLL